MTIEEIKKQIDDFVCLVDNWDGYGAFPTHPSIGRQAKTFINQLPEHMVEKISDIYPNPHGTLSIEWGSEKQKIYLEIGKTTCCYYIKGLGRYAGADDLILKDNIDRIKTAILGLN